MGATFQKLDTATRVSYILTDGHWRLMEQYYIPTNLPLLCNGQEWLKWAQCLLRSGWNLCTIQQCGSLYSLKNTPKQYPPFTFKTNPDAEVLFSMFWNLALQSEEWKENLTPPAVYTCIITDIAVILFKSVHVRICFLLTGPGVVYSGWY